jgi:hypothetical protein
MNFNGLDDRVRDTTGLATFIIDGLPEVETAFFEAVVQAVGKRADIDVTDHARVDLIVRKLRDVGINLRSGGVEEAVLDVMTSTSRESDWAPFLDKFLAENHLSLSFSRRALVLSALDRLSVKPSLQRNLIAQVLDDVTRGSGTDPVQLTRPTGRTSPWDFQVDLFDTSAAQIVLEDNVRAAGALMWCYDIGERLGVYKLTDALVYRWWVGLLDFGDADLTSELYRYYKLRDERPAEEERFLLYRRILDVGEAPVGDRVIVNDEFPALWRTLMEEVATYIDRTESSFRDRVNAQGVVQAIREVQYNLTERMAGMALTQVTEMYNQLRQTETGSGVLGGLDILGHPEVVGQLSSGRRRDQWSVIERLAKEEFGVSPNVSALRTSAVEAFKVVDYIATFREGVVDEDAFDAFIASAKAWILAQQLAGDGLLVDARDAGGGGDGTADYREYGGNDHGTGNDYTDDRFGEERNGNDDTWPE